MRLPTGTTRESYLPNHVIELADLTPDEREMVSRIVRESGLHRLTAIEALRDIWDMPRRQAEMLIDERFGELADER